MQSASKAMLVLMVLSFLTLWGCAQQNTGANNYHTRIRDLEARQAKLEEDYRVVVAANESLRRKIVQLETQRAELTQKIVQKEEQWQQVVRERDELKQQVMARTSERDLFHDQLTQFSHELQNLASRIEAAANSLGPNLPLTASRPAPEMPRAQ